VTVTGLAVLAIGLGWLALARPDGNFWVDILPASIVAATGMALAFIPSLGTAISTTRGRQAGRQHRQHQLPGGLRARPGRDDRTGHHLRRRPKLGNLDALTDRLSTAFIGAAGIAVRRGRARHVHAEQEVAQTSPVTEKVTPTTTSHPIGVTIPIPGSRRRIS
jgi:hypothetical protein